MATGTMRNLKADKDDINRLLHRAIDLDQVTFMKVEAVKLRCPDDPELTTAMDAILDEVMANAEVIQELHEKIIPHGRETINELLSSPQPSRIVVDDAVRNRFRMQNQ
jgi:hypothetical protein